MTHEMPRLTHVFEVDFVGVLGRGRVGILAIKGAVGDEDLVFAVLRHAELDGQILADGRGNAEAVHDKIGSFLAAVHDDADDGALLDYGALHTGAEHDGRARRNGSVYEDLVERTALHGPVRGRLVLTELADDRAVRRDESPALFLETALRHLDAEATEDGRIDVVVPVVTHGLGRGRLFIDGDVEGKLRQLFGGNQTAHSRSCDDYFHG